MSIKPIPYTPGKALHITLWVCQVLVAAVFLLAASMKLTQSPESLDKAGLHWVLTMPPTFVRILGVLDALGGIGLIAPMATKILPRLTFAAAVAATVLQVFAIGMHASRGELMLTPLNFVLGAISAFVAWGRRGL